MRPKTLLFFKIAIPILVITVFAGAACIYYVTNRSTDEATESTSILVYTADCEFAELNQTYCRGRGITPENTTAMVTYEDVPEISEWDGVKGVLIFDEAAFNEFCEDINAGKTVRAAVPAEVYDYFGDPSGMASIFVRDGELVRSGDCYVFECSKGSYESVAAEPDVQFYYEYAPETYDGFRASVGEYFVEYDAYTEDVDCLILVDGDTAQIQQRLMKKFPASNYVSAEFTEVWVDEYNGGIKRELAVAGVVIAVVLVLFEIVLQRSKQSLFETHKK